jgi:hypothetical protein
MSSPNFDILEPSGHDYVVGVPRWDESMPIPYSRNNLGEASYTPASHDQVVGRYVRGPADGGAPHKEPFYAAPRDVPGDGPRPVGV